MYSKLPLKYINITSSYGLRKDPFTGVSTYHYGTDFGYNKYLGEPVFASHDGKVVVEGYDSALGNYVVIRYTEGKNTIINRYLHFKNRAIVKKGNNVKQGEIIGYMGSTGRSTAVHLHFEYWVCPASYTYKPLDGSKYSRDPLKYCYLFDDQTVSSSSSSRVKRVVGFGTTRDKNKNQLRITGKYLNCRSTPSLKGKILGYINLGYYNILDSKEADGYLWYKIGSNKWIAYLKNYVTRYLIDEKVVVSDNSVTDKNENVVDTDSNIDTNIDTNDSINGEDLLSDYNTFTSQKSDYYYIYLEKGETIYYPK